MFVGHKLPNNNMNTIKERKQLQALSRVIRKYIRKSPYGKCTATAKTLAKEAGIYHHNMKNLTLKLLETSDEFIRFEEQEIGAPKLNYVYELASKSSTEEESISREGYKGTHEAEYGSIDIGRNFMDFSGVKSWKNKGRLELIESYIDAGLDIIPVIGKVRRFTDVEWDSTYKGRKKVILNYFALYPEMNVAARQQGEVGIVDVDNYPAMMEILGGEVFDTLISKSGGGERYHWWFHNPQHLPNYSGCNNKAFDFISSQNKYVVLPPSIHPTTGEPYTWEELREPIDLPNEITDLLALHKEVRNETNVTPISPNRYKRVKRGAIHKHKELPTELYEGARHDSLFAYGRHLRWIVGRPMDEVKEKIIGLNNSICKPPLNIKRMDALLKEVDNGKHLPEFESLLKKRGLI